MIIGVFIIVIVCYYEFSVSETHFLPLAPETADSTAEPDKKDETDKTATVEAPEVLRGVISFGDTAGALLQEWLSAEDIQALIEACKNVYPLARIRAGQPYAVYQEGETLSRFEYEIDRDQQLIARRENSRWIATVENIPYEVLLAKVEGRIVSSLFETMSDIGESPALAVRLADIFAWEINFIRDVQSGDSFRILLEKRYRDGEPKGYGKLLAAEFINKGNIFEAFLHKDSFGNAAYFNAAGDSLKRAFLKAPLAFTRISSRFSMHRKHPVFHDIRAHPAVDYAAPTGTPVKAIGSGVVTFRGWGNGAGNYVALKHANGYESMYLHLSGFAKKLQKGSGVKQGEVIGYVGSTGYATGPHLDFRMKKNGQFINPEKVLSPRDESVPAKMLKAYTAARDICRLYLEGKKALTDYTLE
ncbi:MAG: peptidoglycan DD-metalloendopeptidase family protein [Desulfovibrio sp.]|nr:peptidoglycan DD-metalloendopeptidase family protein [Desulfovibrio sp.]